VDEAQKDITDMGAEASLEKEGILAVQDHLFQSAFAYVMPTTGLCRVTARNRPNTEDFWTSLCMKSA
jgi:hypothetical protein